METMSGFMLLTFWLCAGVNYIMLRNMSKRQKGLLLGVTLPPEADALPEVQAIVKQYRTRLGTLCLVCAAQAHRAVDPAGTAGALPAAHGAARSAPGPDAGLRH